MGSDFYILEAMAMSTEDTIQFIWKKRISNALDISWIFIRVGREKNKITSLLIKGIPFAGNQSPRIRKGVLTPCSCPDGVFNIGLDNTDDTIADISLVDDSTLLPEGRDFSLAVDNVETKVGIRCFFAPFLPFV